jgi:type IX secretion system PorP/SprF family membrane protein
MNMKNSIIIVLAICTISFGNLLAQDIHFSQFYMSPLTQNPAMAGANYDIEANVNYKDQWRNVDAPYRTFGVSYDMRTMAKPDKGGFLAAGVNLINDRAGTSRMGYTMANLSLAYHVILNKENSLGLGVQSGIIQRGVDSDYIQWGSQYDGVAYNSGIASGEVMPNTSFTKFDVGGGIVWTYDNTQGGKKNMTGSSALKFNVGLSAFHMTQPDFSYLGSGENLYTKYVGHASATIGISDSRFSILPGFMYYRQGPAQEVYAGALCKITLSRGTEYVEKVEGAAIYFGSYYRLNDAVSTHLLIDYAAFTFGMSYDINVSDLKVGSNGRGGLELSISYVMNNVFKAPLNNSRI